MGSCVCTAQLCGRSLQREGKNAVEVHCTGHWERCQVDSQLSLGISYGKEGSRDSQSVCTLTISEAKEKEVEKSSRVGRWCYSTVRPDAHIRCRNSKPRNIALETTAASQASEEFSHPEDSKEASQCPGARASCCQV